VTVSGRDALTWRPLLGEGFGRQDFRLFVRPPAVTGEPVRQLDMAIDSSNPIEILDEERSWELLLSTSLGRLAVSVAGEPEIFPVNFVAADDRLLFRTAEGTKLAGVSVNSRVAFEIDGVEQDEAWSVVVKGTARVLDKRSEIEAAEELSLHPLIPTLKFNYVEITPNEISGRRFLVGPEPELY
jgi:nitroimidazol reductase NimA-like FMN-containing flavoprotein (pyridoxamine 5'-phosphate oxidase superfamily)